ncbi:MAG: penicillin-binding protein 2 [bacterium]|nr:penicillin-binding protein 2 [bacterium]
MQINKSERNRVFALFILFSLWVLGIGAALVKTQVFDYSKNVNKVRSQSNRTIDQYPKRGTIYDSQGEVLAISVKAKSAFLSNKDKTDSFRLFNDIVRHRFKFNTKKKRDIRRRIGRGDKFIWLKRKLSDKEYNRLKKVKEKNRGGSRSQLGFIEEYKRIYPQGATASHILGGVGIDEQGLYGIEVSLDSTIRGKGGKAKVVQDARHKVFNLQYLTLPVPGRDIYLTIDSSIQFFVEKELEQTVKAFKARSGAVIVMNSHDGSILAMAGYPHYDPGNLKTVSPSRTRNNAISANYHPGSTFKVVLAATALERNICSPQQAFNCYNGVYQVKDRTIYDEHAYERLSFEEIIIYSSNIGAVQIGKKLGRKRYYQGIKNFGFGSRTDIRLPGEENGILHPLNKWSGVSMAFHSYGYEIGVTPLQMIQAFNVMASGGYRIQPYVLKKIDGVHLKGPQKEKILSDGTVHRMVSIMTDVVNKGTGKKARIEGIQVAGKTGTTKKIIPGKNKSKGPRKYVSSFGGFFPAKNPKVTMFVLLDEPKGQFYGGDVAAPLFKSIAEKLSIYLKVFPELDKKREIRL